MNRFNLLPVIRYEGRRALHALFTHLCIDRGLRFVREDEWRTTTSELDEVIALGELIASHRGASHRALIDIEGVLAFVSIDRRSQNISVALAARTASDVEALLERLRKTFVDERPEENVPVVFWHYDGYADSNRRAIECPDWSSLKDNYAGATRDGAAELFEGFHPDGRGKLLLWTGAPGTGKTYALRALANAWRAWCQTEYVTDPENFFGTMKYMNGVLLDDDDLAADQWRLLVLEDTGELLDASPSSAHLLSRFLNVVDGVLGQGLRVMFLVTTNMEAAELHPAVVRPGRCGALVRFERLSVEESNDWLRRRGCERRVERTSTLAQLFAVESGQEVKGRAEREIGFRS